MKLRQFSSSIRWLLHLVITITCIHVFAQTTEQKPVESIDEILRTGTNFGNKAYEGLLGTDRGAIRRDTIEGNSLTTSISGLSTECVLRLELVLQAFSKSNVAQAFEEHGWGNVKVVNLKVTLAGLGADTSSNTLGSISTPAIINGQLKASFDSECQLGRITYTAFEAKYTGMSTTNELVYSYTDIKSTLELDIRQIIPQGENLSGVAKLSEICHTVISHVQTQPVCRQEPLEIFCQDTECYSEPLLQLIEFRKIRSIGMTEPTRTRILEAEQYIEDQRRKDVQKANQVQG